MYDNLKSLGITNPEEIDRYSLRQEANNDILKIYFQKDKGEFSPRALSLNIRVSVKRSSLMVWVRVIKKSRKSARIYGISLMSLIKSASVTAAKLILSVRSSTTYVTWSQS